LHSSLEPRALAWKPAPFRLMTSPPERSEHSVLKGGSDPETGVVPQVAPLDDDVTVADSVGVAAAAMVEVPMSAAPETSAITPIAASIDPSRARPTAPPPPQRDHGARPRPAASTRGRDA